MEQNTTATAAVRRGDHSGAPVAPGAERSGEVCPARWMKLHHVPGAKEILERTGRLPRVLRFKVPQTIHAFRIPEGQSYRVILPDGRELMATEGVNELDPPASVKAGETIRLRFLGPGRAASEAAPPHEVLDAHIEAFWNDPSLDPEPLFPDGGKVTAVQDEVLEDLDVDALEPLEETPDSPERGAAASAVPLLEPASPSLSPVPSFGIRVERHPGLLARFFRTSRHGEGTR